ncbi:hypothetical protein CkaCkLH20_11585 [Colletotrichum karsti]|uniref:SnoaL-like domain-containing protein n=1 Tax=Colletotrichum karsti TaxID=1095194 RepID=A0A9P6LEY2_9PEZI|nr:uncharacterized protein CkaCkLH20_11585 [Colletotrichum karsti]KAF9870913.1 hypothetical protein CkaCkLH20_11585 [Colletotrichum karsti]
MDYYDTASEIEAFLDEVTGPSRDRASRYAIELKVRAMFEDIDSRRWRRVRRCFNKDARVIKALAHPSQIIDRDLDEVIRWFDSLYHNAHGEAVHHAIVPTLVLVDRGRVTCHLTNFWAELPAEDILKFEYFTQYHEIIVLDLDENHKITRFERRAHTQPWTKHTGDIQEFNYFVRMTKRGTVEMEEYFQ